MAITWRQGVKVKDLGNGGATRLHRVLVTCPLGHSAVKLCSMGSLSKDLMVFKCRECGIRLVKHYQQGGKE